MAKYLLHGPPGQKRFYHGDDVHHTGLSVSVAEFAAGKNSPAPAPRRRIVTLTPRELSQLLVDATLQDVPKPPETLSEVLRLQQEQGRR